MQAKFEYSPLGKVFNDGLSKKDKTKKVGILQKLKNIEDNLNSNYDDNGNGKVGIFQIIKDIKDKGIKISNDDEAIREIREHIQNLRNEGVTVNNFDEVNKEIRDHIQNLKDEGIDVNINNDQVNYLVNKILRGKRDSTLKDSASEDSASEDSTSEDSTSEDSASEDPNRKTLKTNTKKFLLIYKEPIITFYKDSGIKYDIDTRKINKALVEYNNKKINRVEFFQIYNAFINDFDNFSKAMNKEELGAKGPN